MRKAWQYTFVYLIVALVTASSLYAQGGIITLANPSFEDMPRHSRTPRYWTNCGFPNESPPDIQPDYTFQVRTLAVSGNTYLGMVVRSNDTWESVGQLMSEPFVKDHCYSFSIKLARSLSYVSIDRETDQPSNYIKPIKLRVWGGFGMCDKQALLAETDVVRHVDWQMYELKLEPDEAYSHIILEAFYNTPTLFPYNGNLLLDDASAIEPIPCDEELPEGPQDFVIEEEIAVVEPAIDDPVISPVVKSPNVSTPQEEEATLAGVKHSDVIKGKTILLQNLQFEADSTSFLPSSLPVLNELYQFMQANKEVRIEVAGHSNGLADTNYANTISKERAKSVFEYLIERGIASNRIEYKGYGKERPIATNETVAGRRKNQRVEIKVL